MTGTTSSSIFLAANLAEDIWSCVVITLGTGFARTVWTLGALRREEHSGIERDGGCFGASITKFVDLGVILLSTSFSGASMCAEPGLEQLQEGLPQLWLERDAGCSATAASSCLSLFK